MKGESVIPNPNSEHLVKKHIEGCVRNERGSQQALYKHYYSFAMGICLRYANNRLDAAGILNDSFFKAFRNISKYENDKGFAPWLAKIVTNTAIDFYRSNLKFSKHIDIDGVNSLTQANVAYDKLAYHDLLKLVQALSPAYRTVFNLFAIDGYSHEEIAKILKISVGTSKSNLFKARQNLQKMLNANEERIYK